MKIALLGDTAFYGKFCVKENPNLYNYLSSVKKELEAYDYVVLNLETPFVNNQKPWGHKSAFIKSAPENIELLKYLGVNAVCLANNHMFDYGQSAFEFTKELLNKYGIQYFGVEDKVVLVEKAGNKIAFSGYCCYSTNPQGLTRRGVNKLDFREVEATLSLYHKQGYSNIVSVHAGQEHVNYPNYDHIQFARKLSDNLPYVYYGHHPHVLQGIEKYKSSVHLYSLGNFCFDDVYTIKSTTPLVKMSENNKRSVIISLEYKDNCLVNNTLIPIYDAQICTKNISDNINELMNEYSKTLQLPQDEYKLKRNRLLREYLASRKTMRNLNWYLKRLNFSSLMQIYNAKANAKKYFKSIVQYLYIQKT